MKKKIKKLIQCFLIVMTIFTSIPVLVNAQTTDTLYIDYDYTYYIATTKFDDLSYWTIGDENPIRRQSDGSYVYCIQAHIKFNDNSPVNGYESSADKLALTDLTLEEIEKIELYAYYGYGYGNHNSLDWYAATQLLIWEVTEKVAKPYPIAEGDRTLTRIDKYDSKMNEIRELVAKHGKTVSFNNQTVDMKVGETITLHDNNEVLSNYFTVESNDKLDMKINDNDLVITAKNGYEGTINLNAKKNTNVPMIYDGSNQKCLSRGDPTFINGRINMTVYTEFKINKLYGSDNKYAPEEKAEFEIYNNDTNELIETVSTNEDGLASIYLQLGNYRVVQTKGAEGYELIKDYIFSINGNHTKETVYFYNEKIVVKTDEEKPEEPKKEIVIEVPDTIIHDNYTIEICAVIVLIIGIGVVIYENKRK